MAQHGWRYEVWSGEAPRLLENLRFIAQGRLSQVDKEALRVLRGSGRVGLSLEAALAGAAHQGAVSPRLLRAALLRLLWLQEWVVDLSVPLTREATISKIEEPA